MIDDYEKSRLGAKTLCEFFNQFGNDVHAQILLEVLMEGLINEESVFISGEQEQTGDQDDNLDQDGHTSIGEIEGHIDPESSTALGEEDISIDS